MRRAWPLLILLLLVGCTTSDPSVAAPPTPTIGETLTRSPSASGASPLAVPSSPAASASPAAIDDASGPYRLSGETGESFSTPSRNIKCTLESVDDRDWVTCSIARHAWASPACPTGQVTSLYLAEDAANKTKVGCTDQDQRSFRVLPYGHSLRDISITCTSTRKDLTCRSGRHGFHVSQAAYSTF